jgi:t-SNARE complex subunit (syntaxin)
MRTMTQQFKKMDEDIQKLHSDVRDINTHISYIRISIESFNKHQDTCSKKFVKMERFSPVEKIVYGMVALILLSVLGALIKSVVALP